MTTWAKLRAERAEKVDTSSPQTLGALKDLGSASPNSLSR